MLFLMQFQLQTDYIPDEMRMITQPIWTESADNKWYLDILDLDMSAAFTEKPNFMSQMIQVEMTKSAKKSI